MRTVEEIKADIASAKQPIWKRQFENELYKALTSDIPIARLETICAAENDGRCVVLPCKPGNAYWHRNRDTGQLELNFEMYDLEDHDDTYPEIDCCAYWE